MKLYEIALEYRQFMELVESEEIPLEAIGDTLESITAELEEKADNIACIIKTLKAEVEAIKAEERNLAERRKAKEARADRLTEYLAETLLGAGYDKIETARNKITFRKSEPVNITDEAEFIAWAAVNRDDVLKYGEPKIDKTAVKKAIQSGAALPFASIEKRMNIQIK